MQKEHVEGRIEETIGKVTEVAGKVFGNKALEQAGTTHRHEAGHDGAWRQNRVA